MEYETRQKIVESIVKELKKKYTNLSAEDAIKLAHTIENEIHRIIDMESK